MECSTEKSWCFKAEVHDRFQEWRKAGVFKQMWIDGLAMYDKKTGIDWKWQAMDGAHDKSTSWGKKAQDQIPQTESNSGTKRSILVDGKGCPTTWCMCRWRSTGMT